MSVERQYPAGCWTYLSSSFATEADRETSAEEWLCLCSRCVAPDFRCRAGRSRESQASIPFFRARTGKTTISSHLDLGCILDVSILSSCSLARSCDSLALSGALTSSLPPSCPAHAWLHSRAHSRSTSTCLEGVYALSNLAVHRTVIFSCCTVSVLCIIRTGVLAAGTSGFNLHITYTVSRLHLPRISQSVQDSRIRCSLVCSYWEGGVKESVGIVCGADTVWKARVCVEAKLKRRSVEHEKFQLVMTEWVASTNLLL